MKQLIIANAGSLVRGALFALAALFGKIGYDVDGASVESVASALLVVAGVIATAIHNRKEK